MKRTARLKTNPAKVRAWQDSSRRQLPRLEARLDRALARSARIKRTTDAIPPKVRGEVVARALHRCEIEGCDQGVDHLHHRLMRSQGGPHTEANLLGLCSPHHDDVHHNPERSYALGLLVRRHSAEGRALLAEVSG